MKKTKITKESEILIKNEKSSLSEKTLSDFISEKYIKKSKYTIKVLASGIKKDDRFDGVWIFTNRQCEKLLELTFKDTLKNGECNLYQDNRIIVKGQYKNDKKDGIWTFYFEDIVEEWKNGKFIKSNSLE